MPDGQGPAETGQATDPTRAASKSHKGTSARRLPWNLVLLLALSVLSIVILGLAAVMLVESWARSTWDNNLLLANADRVRRLGGTYFTTTASQKGPIWQWLFDVSLMVASRRDVWFVIAAMVVSISALTGAAVMGLLRAARIPAWAALATGIATAVFMWFTAEEWGYALYSRNIVILLTTTSLALIVAASRSTGLARMVAVVVAGALIGLGVQTNQGSALVAVLGLTALWLLARAPGQSRANLREVLGLSALFTAAFFVALASAPLWYLWRGVFEDFWYQWWTHNLHYTEATGRSYLSILVKGVTDFVNYYVANRIYAITVLAYIVVYLLVVPRLASWDRRLGVLLVAWWLVEVASVALSQRFFPHYLVLSFVPVAVMAGALLGKSAAWFDSRSPAGPMGREVRFALATLVVVVALNLNMGRVGDGLSKLTAFRGLEAAAAMREASGLSETDAELRRVVDTWSESDDFVYAWTNWPYIWEVMRRSPATRYTDKHWLSGEIFFGGTSAEWIPPEAWDNWIADMSTTKPTLIVTFPADPLPVGSPLEQVIGCGYTKVADSDALTAYRATSELGDCLEDVARLTDRTSPGDT